MMVFKDEPSAPISPPANRFDPSKDEGPTRTYHVEPENSFAGYAKGDEWAAFLALTKRLNELSASFKDVRERLLYVRNERRKLRDRWKKRARMQSG